MAPGAYHAIRLQPPPGAITHSVGDWRPPWNSPARPAIPTGPRPARTPREQPERELAIVEEMERRKAEAAPRVERK